MHEKSYQPLPISDRGIVDSFLPDIFAKEQAAGPLWGVNDGWQIAGVDIDSHLCNA